MIKSKKEIRVSRNHSRRPSKVGFQFMVAFILD